MCIEPLALCSPLGSNGPCFLAVCVVPLRVWSKPRLRNGCSQILHTTLATYKAAMYNIRSCSVNNLLPVKCSQLHLRCNSANGSSSGSACCFLPEECLPPPCCWIERLTWCRSASINRKASCTRGQVAASLSSGLSTGLPSIRVQTHRHIEDPGTHRDSTVVL